MVFFNRKLYLNKPRMYGPPSVVQSSLFANAERAGIDPGSIALCMPMWEMAGLSTDYSDFTRSGAFEGSSSWHKNGIRLQNPTISCVPFNKTVSWADNTPYSIVMRLKKTDATDTKAIVAGYGTSVSYGYIALYTLTDKIRIRLASSVDFTGFTPFDTTSTISITCDGNSTAAIKAYQNGHSRGQSNQSNSAFDFDRLGIINSSYSAEDCTWDSLFCFNTELRQSQIAHLSDNPYFLLHRQPSVFYSVPSGAITLRQFGFRFYQDDAAPGSATVLGDQDANVSLAPGSKFRIRVGIDAEGDPTSKDFQLEYRRKPSGGTFGDWGKVT